MSVISVLNDTIQELLKPLADEAKKYSDFKEFSHDYSLKCIRGKYYHLTEDPNFKLKKSYSPRDLSSLSAGYSGTPGLMITCDLELWSEYFPKRKYAVIVDMSKAIKGKDFIVVERGFGHEIFVHNLDIIKVGKPMTLREAIKDMREFDAVIPNSELKLKRFWEKAREGK